MLFALENIIYILCFLKDMNPKIHLRKRLRLQGYDYSFPGYYFITICTKGRICRFGEIKNGEMHLSQAGKIVEQCWHEIPVHFQNVRLDEFVVMPNHVHGIVVIRGNDIQEKNLNDNVGKRHAFSLPKRQHQKLPNIIGSFKSAVTKNVRHLAIETNFAWQTSYHDHIIRTENALANIRDYIFHNPLQWAEDMENISSAQTLSPQDKEQFFKKHYKTFIQ